jgi:hypothetical protein
VSKKHFIALADVVRVITNRVRNADATSILANDSSYVVELFTRELADFCASQNHNFNRSRWLDYIAGECGPNGGRK